MPLSLGEIARRKDAARAKADCGQWNASNPIGTAVTVRKDDGSIHNGVTRSEAQVSQSGHAVIFVSGISGYYSLSRVEAV